MIPSTGRPDPSAIDLLRHSAGRWLGVVLLIVAVALIAGPVLSGGPHECSHLDVVAPGPDWNDGKTF